MYPHPDMKFLLKATLTFILHFLRKFRLFWPTNDNFKENFWDLSRFAQIWSKSFEQNFSPPYPPTKIFGQVHVCFELTPPLHLSSLKKVTIQWMVKLMSRSCICQVRPCIQNCGLQCSHRWEDLGSGAMFEVHDLVHAGLRPLRLRVIHEFRRSRGV
jgi:hypothetical protein